MNEPSNPTTNPRWRVYLIAMLAIAVFIAALYVPVLRRRLTQAKDVTTVSEEQARRELTQPSPTNPKWPSGKSKIVLVRRRARRLADAGEYRFAARNGPAPRGKQVLNTLLAGPIEAELRTLPPDAVCSPSTCCPTALLSLIFPKRWPHQHLPEFKANRWPSIPSQKLSKPTCRK